MDIKSMGLYRNVERILADLKAGGHALDGTLTVDDLTPYDQYHYEGTDAVDDAIAFLQPTETTRILDIGSGLGGPARYLADRTGTRVSALEIQPDLHQTAQSLTERCGLVGRVEHLCGDVLDGVAQAGAYSGIVSMLCFLHIPDRPRLLDRCAEALAPGGALFVDDFYQRLEFTDTEKAALASKVFCPSLPTLERYIADLDQAGFIEIDAVDKTDDWTIFVSERLAQFRSSQAELSQRYGLETVAGLDDFYATIAGLFERGNLGGVRITARLAE